MARVRWLIRLFRFHHQTTGRLLPGPIARYAWHRFEMPPPGVSKMEPPRKARVALEEATHLRVAHDGDDLPVWIWEPLPDAPRTSGEPPLVALAHGWSSRGFTMLRWLPRLREIGCRVLAYDGPGHQPLNKHRATSAPETALALAAIREAIGQPIRGIVGHSFGGLVAAVAASGQAETVLPAHIRNKPEQARPLEVHREMASEIQAVVTLAAPNGLRAIIDDYAHFMRLPPRAAAHLRRIFAGWVGQPLEQISTGRLLGHAGVPSMIIHDRRDEEVAFPLAEILASEAAPHATLVALDGHGHRRILLADEAIDPGVSFLQQHLLPGAAGV